MEFVAVGCVYKEVVGALSNCNVRNLTSGDLVILLVVIRPGVTGLKKTRLVYLPDQFEGRGEKEQFDLVCGAPLNDWANASYVNVLFTCGEGSFNSLESWCCSEERV